MVILVYRRWQMILCNLNFCKVLKYEVKTVIKSVYIHSSQKMVYLIVTQCCHQFNYNSPYFVSGSVIKCPNWTKLSAPWIHVSQELFVCVIFNDVVSITVAILHRPLDCWRQRHHSPSKRSEMLIYRYNIVAYRTQVLRKNTVITSNFIQCLCLLLYEIWWLCCTTLRIFMSLLGQMI
jgi:hypothetical protein